MNKLIFSLINEDCNNIYIKKNLRPEYYIEALNFLQHKDSDINKSILNILKSELLESVELTDNFINKSSRILSDVSVFIESIYSDFYSYAIHKNIDNNIITLKCNLNSDFLNESVEFNITDGLFDDYYNYTVSIFEDNTYEYAYSYPYNLKNSLKNKLNNISRHNNGSILGHSPYDNSEELYETVKSVVVMYSSVLEYVTELIDSMYSYETIKESNYSNISRLTNTPIKLNKITTKALKYMDKQLSTDAELKYINKHLPKLEAELKSLEKTYKEYTSKPISKRVEDVDSYNKMNKSIKFMYTILFGAAGSYLLPKPDNYNSDSVEKIAKDNIYIYRNAINQLKSRKKKIEKMKGGKK